MNGNQITISVNSTDFAQLRKIAKVRGQTVSDYISYLVSSNLIKSDASLPTPPNGENEAQEIYRRRRP